jgi:anti-sigma regulatory factor (Ser/Thr protein kinase)
MRTGPARDATGNVHEAGFYRTDAEFLALIHPFVTEGLTAGEPVIIGYDERKCDLIRATLRRPEQVAFVQDTSLYASPARAIEAYRQQFERHVAAGAQQIRIAGDVPHEGNGGRFAGWDRYESAVNTVWQSYPVWSRCLYDATTAHDDVRDVVVRTHPRLVTPDGTATASPQYQDVPEFAGLPPTADPLEGTTPSVRLGDPSLKRTRRSVAEAARGSLDPAAFDELLFAVSEALINAQSYGHPPVAVRVWTAPDRVVVHVHDIGPGPPDPLTGLVPVPEGTSGAGLGLWLSHQLQGVEVDLITEAEGFTVRLRAGSPPPTSSDPDDGCVLRAGTLRGAPPATGTVHAIDGDGASLCEIVDTTDLHPLDDLRWPDVPAVQQCPHCRLIMAVDDGTPRP